MIHVASFYKFFDFPHYEDFKKPLAACMCSHGVKGSILLASEGFNGTISGSEEGVEATLAMLRALPLVGVFDVKDSQVAEHPFKRTKVKLKREIIPFGLPCDPARKTGTHLDYAQWNQLLSDPETIVLDTRNAYEVEHGSFERALDPKIRHFRHLPDYIQQHLLDAKDRPVATFCTGGVRCEKLTSWMLEQGFTRVYQLGGGILKYMEECPKEQSKWQGECFVFDERVALDDELKSSAR